MAGATSSGADLKSILAQNRSGGGKWILAVVLLLCLGGVWMFMQVRAATAEVSLETRYQTTPARLGELIVTVSATGNLAPTNEVEVGSEQSGIVSVINVEANDEVSIGQVLAQLDTTRIDAQIQQAEANLASAEAQVLSAEATAKEKEANVARLEKLRELSNGRGLAAQDVDTAQAELDRAIAGVEQAKAAVRQNEAALATYRTDRSKMTIVSPINGVVLTRNIDKGQTVAASFEAPTLFVLAEDLSRMQLKVGVDEADIALVKKEQEATFTVDAFPNREFPARVTRVNFGSTTTNNVVTYETVLDVDNSSIELRPGMTATATIIVRELKDVLLIPNAALRFQPPQTTTQESSGNILNMLLPRPPRAQRKDTSVQPAGQAKVWTLQGNELVAISVKTGQTDGNTTEVLEGDLGVGTLLVTDVGDSSK